jgi:hypothetical protein
MALDADLEAMHRHCASHRAEVLSVIGSNAGMQLDERFLSQMHAYWFER